MNEKTPPKFVFLLVFAALLTAACGGDSLGPQIDRMGRAAVNTALIQPFTASMDVKQAAKDNYNATNNSIASSFASDIAASLAFYDALVDEEDDDTDGSHEECGDNALSATGTGPDTYASLAALLANDQLVINSEEELCTRYLAVELGTSGQCGGRTPLMDAVDTTYSVIAAGAATGVRDGIHADDTTASVTTFPFLAAPQ